MANPAPKATPIIITPPPPPPPPPGDDGIQPLITKRFDWTNFTKKLSTLVAASVLALGTISATIMGYYTTLPPEQKAAWPFWVPVALVLGPTILSQLGPVAVAFRQVFWDDTDQAGA